MKKPIFDKGLYLEGLRQNRLIGILYTVINAVIAAAIPLITVMDIQSYTDMDSEITPETLHFFTPINVSLLLVFILFAPILTEHLFSFLNKRNTSDFYHSLPHTRICLYVSYTLSILTWIVFAVAVQTGVFLFILSIFPKYFTLMYATVLPTVLSILAMAFLVTATFLIAMSLTGTVFNNFIIAVLILFLPRFAMFLVDAVVTDSIPQAVSGRLFPLFGNKYNMITTLVFGLFNWDFSIESLFTTTSAIVYTFILAAIYFVIAGLLFNIRKSEMAGSSASGRKMQAVFRIVVCMAFCLVACMFIFTNIVFHESDEIDMILIFYLIALIAFFVYEAIATKKWKNLLRAIPCLGIVAILNVVVIAGMLGLYYSQLNFTPDAKDIDEFSIISPSNEDGSYYTFYHYITLRSEDIPITDPKLVGYVADALQFDVDTWKNASGNRSIYYDTFNPNDVDRKFETEEEYNKWLEERQRESYAQINVRIKSGLRTKYRTIHINALKSEEIYESLRTNENLRSLYMNLPSHVKGTGSIQAYNEYLSISADRFSEIFAMFREEVRQCDYATWYNDCAIAGYNESRISFSTVMDGRAVQLTICTSPTQTPKTNKMIEDVWLEQQKAQLKEYRDLIGSLAGKAEGWLDMNITFANYGMYGMEDFYNTYVYMELAKDGYADVMSKENYEMVNWLIDNALLQRIPKQDDTVLRLRVNCNYFLETDKNEYGHYEKMFSNFTLPLDLDKALENELFAKYYENRENIEKPIYDDKIIYETEYYAG